MKLTEVSRRDDLIVDFIFKHKGRSNVVSAKEIANYLKEHGFETKETTLRMAILRVAQRRHLPICSSRAPSRTGYYWAENAEDVIETIKELESVIAGMNEHIAHLKNFILQ